MWHSAIDITNGAGRRLRNRYQVYGRTVKFAFLRSFVRSLIVVSRLFGAKETTEADARY